MKIDHTITSFVWEKNVSGLPYRDGGSQSWGLLGITNIPELEVAQYYQFVFISRKAAGGMTRKRRVRK